MENMPTSEDMSRIENELEDNTDNNDADHLFLPTPEEEKVEGAVIDAIEQIVMHLKKLGITHDDLYRENEKDPQPIKQLKRRLKMRLNQLATSWAKRRERHGGKFDVDQKEAQQEIDEEIKRFLDFDHTRDRDGRKSLGETGRNVSAFEKGLLARELVKRGRELNKAVSHFKEQLMNKVSEIRQTLMQELGQHALKTGVHVAAVQTGMPVSMVKEGVAFAQQIKESERNFNQTHSKTAEQQRAAAEQLVSYAGNVAAGNIAPPGITPGGFAEQVLSEQQGQGGVGR